MGTVQLIETMKAGELALRVIGSTELEHCSSWALMFKLGLPGGSAIEQMLADYQVMRDQARCATGLL